MLSVDALTLPFLGRRDYLHGTTLFDALTPFTPSDAELVFKFSKIIRSNVVFLSSSAEAGGASLSWRNSQSAGTIHVRAGESCKNLERRAYSEVLITDKVKVERDFATYEGDSPFSFAATLIPMHKALLAHCRIAADAPPGQWVFTRLDLCNRPASFQRIEMKLSRILDRQLVRSEVIVEGISLGEIYFSWLRKP